MCRCRHDQSEHVDGSDMIPRLLAKGGEHVDGALQHLLKVRARPRVRIRVRKGLELRVRVGVGVRVRGVGLGLDNAPQHVCGMVTVVVGHVAVTRLKLGEAVEQGEGEGEGEGEG